MKQRTLLLFVMSFLITNLYSQKKEQPPTGFAITAQEKGGRNWKEVKLVNMATGEELKTIYSSSTEVEALNARTGKPVQKKEIAPARLTPPSGKKVVNLDQQLDEGREKYLRVYNTNDDHHLIRLKTDADGKVIYMKSGYEDFHSNKPFATNSAAMAYDKKHEKLYYTPMGINQLRYIDLKSGKIYYFEDEPFGFVSGMGDAPNQITRMVIASDGEGYALTNDAKHLLRFSTGKKTVISDLGEVTDEGADAKVSVHNPKGYGGDMIADASGNLYLITANRNVFKIGLESRSAKYIGAIKGLPAGFSTNGAMVEEGSKVIIASAESTVGYYRFDLNSLQAEKISASTDVFNASDLANGNLAFDKKKKDKKEEEVKEETKPEQAAVTAKTDPLTETREVEGISVYPNPVSNAVVKLSFDSQPPGKYQVQLFNLDGKLISSQEVILQNKQQVEDLKLPEGISRGTYLVKIFNQASKVSSLTKLVVQ